jgi:hypothetical protein
MDSNSTLVPDQHSSSWKREYCCVEGDHVAMATHNDNHSESDHCIAYPAFPRLRLRIDSRIAALPEVTTAKSLGGSWIGDPAVAPIASTSCHPAVSHGYAAQAGDTNDVICTAGGRSFQCHEASSAHIHFQKHPDNHEDS